MDNQIRYTITANDMVSGKLQGMQGQAVKLESTMGGLTKIMGTLGVGFAVFKGLDFVKAGIEKVEEMHQATAQVQAALTSTNNAAGLSMKQLEESAASLASNTKFSSTDVFGMQSLLLTFTSVKDKIFNEAQPAIMDLAQRMGGDLKGASIQVGKALNDPTQGMTALRRVGVSFSEEQKTVIKRLQETGDLAGAQKIILKELASEFGGSAQAAFNADPLAQFNKTMGSFQKSVGQVAMDFLEKLAPSLVYIANLFKSLGKFLKEHADILIFITGVYITYKGIMLGILAWEKLNVYWKGVSATATALLTAYDMARAEGMGVLTAAQWALNIAMDANPIGLIVLGIAAAIALVAEIVVHFNDWGAALTLLMGPVGLLISGIMSIYNHWQSIKDAFNTGGMIGGLKRIGVVLFDAILYPLQQAMHWIGKITGAQWAKDGANQLMGYRKSLDLVTEDETKKKTTKNAIKEVATKPKNGLAGAPTGKIATGGKPTKGTAGVQGNKAVTVNIQIGSLIHDFSIKTTNIQESATAIKEKVVMALTSAVNDSQLIAGN